MDIFKLGDKILALLEAVFGFWNNQISLVFAMLGQSPVSFKGGGPWAVIEGIEPVFVAVGSSLVVLFFVIGFCSESIDVKDEMRFESIFLNPKKMLDDIRLLCRGKSTPIKEAYERFNRETDDGRNMAEMSELLSEAINSIIDVKEESDIDSLFSAGGTSALMSDISGLDDFELICFLVVK